MLIFTYKMEKYVKKILVPKLLIDPNKYVIKGSFRRRIPYVTDIDIVNDVYPEINENNIYPELVKLIKRVNQDKSIILISITCGTDERFRIKTGSEQELIKIKELLQNQEEIEQFDTIIKKYQNDVEKRIFYANELIWKYLRLRWKPQEVLDNQKILSQDFVVKFTDIVKENIMLLLQYFVKINDYPIGVDVIVNYKPMAAVGTYYTSINDYQIKLANYAKEYYYMLFPLRAYFRNNRKIYQELETIIEKKFGLYKQLMVRIDTYHILYDTNNLDIRTATTIVTSIVRDIKYLPDFSSNTITKIAEVAQNNPLDVKMRQWYILLDVLYDDIDMAASVLAKEYFFKYLHLLPENLQGKYYLGDDNQNRIKSNKKVMKIY